MGVLKIKDPADPTGATWIDIMGTGTQGPPGGPVPVGGNPGEVIQKTGPADMEVGWAVHPRVAFKGTVASITTHATASTFVDAVFGSATIDPNRTYHIIAGWRCIQDTDSKHRAQAQVAIGTVNLDGYDVVANNDTDGLWGAWSQHWIEDGSRFVAAGSAPAALDVRLKAMFSFASKIIYSPRLFIIEY